MIEIKVDHYVKVNLAVEETFDYISDLENMVEWASAMVEVKKVSPQELRIGTMIESRIRFLGRWFDMAFEIIECEPNRCLTLKSTAFVWPWLICYRFDQDESGQTVISQEAIIQSVEGVMDLNLTKPVLTDMTRRMLEYDLLTLKDVLEAKWSSYKIA